MRELAGAVEAMGGERVGGTGVDGPVGGGGVIAGGVEGLAVEEEAFVVAVPGVGLYWECVCGIRCPLVVAMDLDLVSLVLWSFSNGRS